MFTHFDPLTLHTPYLFFTGKGGVGKTSTACATAITLTEQGKHVLLVSTDPASNLEDLLGSPVSASIESVPGIDGLSVCNIDPEEAARIYREKMIGPYRGLLPEDAVLSMEEQLSGACTVEMAAFDEFTSLLSDHEKTADFDVIIFDTAPTGHTLRLLQLPAAWTNFLETSTHGVSCLGPLSGLQDKEVTFRASMTALKDPAQTSLVLVTRPDSDALKEAARSSRELRENGLGNQQLILNGWVEKLETDDPMATAYVKRQRDAWDEMKNVFSSLPVTMMPFSPAALTNLSALSKWMKKDNSQLEEPAASNAIKCPDTLETYVEQLIKRKQRIIMTMGKGGVGKTTMAASIASLLAEKGHSVQLTTTDPADHVTQLSQERAFAACNITRIDPAQEVIRYTESVLHDNISLSEDERAFLAEDLRSPCTEEIAVFHAFTQLVMNSPEEFIVVDTAPTGHTLLLLESAHRFEKEMERNQAALDRQSLIDTLRNPDKTSIAIVTLAEATPVLEATRLQEELDRAGIQADWWIINQSLHAAGTSEPLFKMKAAQEAKWLEKVLQKNHHRTAVVPWMAEPFYKMRGELVNANYK